VNAEAESLVGYCPLPCNRPGDQHPVQFRGFRIPIRHGKFSLVLNDISDRFLWSGTITPRKASGKESIDLAAFDNQGGPAGLRRGFAVMGGPGSGPGVLGDRIFRCVFRR
jgi:hypothetical protein